MCCRALLCGIRGELTVSGFTASSSLGFADNAYQTDLKGYGDGFVQQIKSLSAPLSATSCSGRSLRR